MKIGYAHVSTTDQNINRQIVKLETENCQKIFQEKALGKNAKCPELQKILNFIRENDEVVLLV